MVSLGATTAGVFSLIGFATGAFSFNSLSFYTKFPI
jgi:hypothetical protein